MTLLELATDLQRLASGPDILDGVDMYYADDITIVEANGEVFHGRETQKGRIQEWLSSVTDIVGADLVSIAAHETAPGSGVVFAETTGTFSFADGSSMLMEEVAVQRWADGRVVHERFYFNMPDMSGG